MKFALAAVMIATVAAATPASACRARVFPDPNAALEQPLLFIARVDTIDRSPVDGGERIRVTVSTLQSIEGEPDVTYVAESSFGANREEVIIADCSRGRPLAGELDLLIPGDEVVVRAWRLPDGRQYVSDLARRDRARSHYQLRPLG